MVEYRFDQRTKIGLMCLFALLIVLFGIWIIRNPSSGQYKNWPANPSDRTVAQAVYMVYLAAIARSQEVRDSPQRMMDRNSTVIVGSIDSNGQSSETTVSFAEIHDVVKRKSDSSITYVPLPKHVKSKAEHDEYILAYAPTTPRQTRYAVVFWSGRVDTVNSLELHALKQK